MTITVFVFFLYIKQNHDPNIRQRFWKKASADYFYYNCWSKKSCRFTVWTLSDQLRCLFISSATLCWPINNSSFHFYMTLWYLDKLTFLTLSLFYSRVKHSEWEVGDSAETKSFWMSCVCFWQYNVYNISLVLLFLVHRLSL